MVLLAKTLAELSFGGAFAWYIVKYVVSGVLAVGAIVLGIKLRKKKNANMEMQKTAEE